MLVKEPLFPIKDHFAPYRHVDSVLEYGDLDAIRHPKISVIIPVYNHPEYLEETLMSVINQDYNDEYEIIVVDNNMTKPHSPNYDIITSLDNPKVLYYRHGENIRFEGNCNRGVELARAKYITFCHDDDLLFPDALSTLMQIQKETGDKAIIANFNIIDDKSNLIDKPFFNPCKHKLYVEESIFWLIERCARLQIGSLWNKEKFITSGGYSPEQTPCQDYGLHAIYGSLYGSVMCLKPTFLYRKANNASRELCVQFPLRERFIMENLRNHVRWIPRFYLNLVISVAIKRVINGNIQTWGIKEEKQELTFLEKIANRIDLFLYNRKITKNK